MSYITPVIVEVQSCVDRAADWGLNTGKLERTQEIVTAQAERVYEELMELARAESAKDEVDGIIDIAYTASQLYAVIYGDKFDCSHAWVISDDEPEDKILSESMVGSVIQQPESMRLTFICAEVFSILSAAITDIMNYGLVFAFKRVCDNNDTKFWTHTSDMIEIRGEADALTEREGELIEARELKDGTGFWFCRVRDMKVMKPRNYESVKIDESVYLTN